MKLTNKTRYSAYAAVLALGLVTAGCGGSSSTSATPAGATSPVQVSLGDAPADGIMAFGMNVNSITLTNSSGGTVNVLSSPVHMEMMSQLGTVQPLTMANVPQGTYTQAMVNFSPQSIGYMDQATNLYVQVPKTQMGGTYSGTMIFNPPMTIGSGASVLGIDMNMANAVSIDGSGNVTIDPNNLPMFTAMMNPASAGSQSPWQGYMQGMVGAVASTNGTSQFSMSMMLGQPSITLSTNSGTVFEGMNGMGGMSSGMLVVVDAATQADGSLLAQHVTYMEGSSGMMGAGIIGSLTGAPPTQLTMAANNGIGGGMMMSNISETMGINISGSTSYPVDTDNGNIVLTGLPFTPTFNASHIALGQKIDVISSGGMMGGGMMGGGMMNGPTSATIDASQIQLEQQGMHGTVSNYNGSSFTLTMPSGSAFTTLTGVSSITVYQQAGTQMFPAGSTVTNNSQVEVRGLLFDDSGAYKMVSTWIVTPAST
jgi:Domain of unknown function (DUF5666)